MYYQFQVPKLPSITLFLSWLYVNNLTRLTHQNCAQFHSAGKNLSKPEIMYQNIGLIPADNILFFFLFLRKYMEEWKVSLNERGRKKRQEKTRIKPGISCSNPIYLPLYEMLGCIKHNWTKYTLFHFIFMNWKDCQ